MHRLEYLPLQYPLSQQHYKQTVMSFANSGLVCTAHWMVECGCVVPAYAARCVRPLLGGEGAGEGEPTSVYRSPAREVEEAVENEKTVEKKMTLETGRR